MPQDAVLFAAGLSGALAAVITVALRRELAVPVTLSLLLVPVIVSTGYLVAIGLRYWLDTSLLEVAGLLAGLLVLLVAAYECVLLLVTDTPPPTVRF